MGKILQYYKIVIHIYIHVLSAYDPSPIASWSYEQYTDANTRLQSSVHILGCKTPVNIQCNLKTLRPAYENYSCATQKEIVM